MKEKYILPENILIDESKRVHVPKKYIIDFNYMVNRMKRNKQRAAFAGTNNINHDVKWFRWKHIEAQHMFVQETDGN